MYIPNYKQWKALNEQLTDADIEFNNNFPEVDYDNYDPPKDQLYRWLTPGDLLDYLEKPDLEESGMEDRCKDEDGNDISCKGVPFFERRDKFYGMSEPMVRIILDREKIEADGHEIFNPRRDPGEVRVKDRIKNWIQYLVAFEVSHEEFALQWSDEYDDYYSEFPTPLPLRKKMWDEIQRVIPKDKIKIVDLDFYSKTVPFFSDNTF